MVNSRATALYKLMDSILKMGLGLVEEITGKIVSGFKLNYPIMVSQENNPFGIDTSIEGMNSQEFSVAIFYFLVAAIAIFTIFVFMFMFKDRTSKLKTPPCFASKVSKQTVLSIQHFLQVTQTIILALTAFFTIKLNT